MNLLTERTRTAWVLDSVLDDLMVNSLKLFRDLGIYGCSRRAISNESAQKGLCLDVGTLAPWAAGTLGAHFPVPTQTSRRLQPIQQTPTFGSQTSSLKQIQPLRLDVFTPLKKRAKSSGQSDFLQCPGYLAHASSELKPGIAYNGAADNRLQL